MRTMTLNQITAALAALVLAAVSLLMWALAVVLSPPAISADPTRYCFGDTVKAWSCYLKDDAPTGLTPVWVGPESQIKKAWQAAQGTVTT